MPLKPRVVVSSCLAGENVRYDGKPVEDEFSQKLIRYTEVIKVCPEVGIGLGVPRDRVIVYLQDKELRLSQPSTGLELTERMSRFSKDFFEQLPEVDGFLLKSKSPSCGVSRTKTYKDQKGEHYRGLGKGLFASEVLKRFPYLPVEDELRLRSHRVRLLFTLSLFALAYVRERSAEEFHRRFGNQLKYFLPRLERKLRRADTHTYRKLLLKVFGGLPSGVLNTLAQKLVPPNLLP